MPRDYPHSYKPQELSTNEAPELHEQIEAYEDNFLNVAALVIWPNITAAFQSYCVNQAREAEMREADMASIIELKQNIDGLQEKLQTSETRNTQKIGRL